MFTEETKTTQAQPPCVEWMTDFAKIKGFNVGRSVKRSSGLFKCWWTKRMFRILTRSKNLRIPRLKKEFEVDLEALKVISFSV